LILIGIMNIKGLAKVIKTDNIFDYYLELMRFMTLFDDGHTAA